MNLDQECEAHILWMESLLNDKPQIEQKSEIDYKKEIDDLIKKITSDRSDSNASNQTNSETQYRISEIGDSEDEENEQTYIVDDSNQMNGKKIPEWAKASNLLVELQNQQTIDPDSIFPYFDPNVDLSKMFNKKKKSYKIRGDSGWWAGDGVTQNEIHSYKKAIGLA